MCPLLILFNAQCLNLRTKKWFLYVVVVAILYQSASAQYPTIFSFFISRESKVCCIFLFFLLVERRVGNFTKVLLTISFTDGSSIECIKGVVAWAWHPYIG